MNTYFFVTLSWSHLCLPTCSTNSGVAAVHARACQHQLVPPRVQPWLSIRRLSQLLRALTPHLWAIGQDDFNRARHRFGTREAFLTAVGLAKPLLVFESVRGRGFDDSDCVAEEGNDPIRASIAAEKTGDDGS